MWVGPAKTAHRGQWLTGRPTLLGRQPIAAHWYAPDWRAPRLRDDDYWTCRVASCSPSLSSSSSKAPALFAVTLTTPGWLALTRALTS